MESNSTFVVNDTKMSKKVPPLDENKLRSNPFTETLIIPINERIDPIIKVKDENGKEVAMVNPMEWTKSTKVYHNKGAGDMALALSAGGLRMYVYIIHKIESAQDWIRIMPENYATKSDRGSINTYKRAINELIEAKYICLSPCKYTYYINPARIFCGSRMQKYPDNLELRDRFTGKDPKAPPKKGSKQWMDENEPK